MANPDTLVGEMTAVLVASTEAASIPLDADYEYSLGHNGKDGVSGDPATSDIFIGLNAAVTANYEPGANKLILTTTRPATIGPGVGELHFQLAAGASDAPTFQVLRGPKWVGKY